MVSRALAATGLLIGAASHPGGVGEAGFVAWDGQWYLRAGLRGFGGPLVPGVESPWAFFPVLPGLLRAADAAHLPAAALMVVVDHALLFVALVGVWRLAERRFGAEVAGRAVWVLALFPMAGVFSMLYPSSIYLAASVWAFEFAERRWWGWCGAVVAVATMVRPNGAVVVAVLTVATFTQRVPGDRWRRVVAVAGPSTVSLAVWMVAAWRRTGDPFVFVWAKGAWEEHTVVGAIHRLFTGPTFDHLAVHGLLGAVAALTLVLAWRRLPRSWQVLAAIALGLPAITGLVGVGRYANECFPLVIAGGVIVGRLSPAVRVLAAAASASAMVVVSVSIGGYGLVP